MNGLILQAFEWYLPNDGNHYNYLKSQLDYFKELGITALWLPPFCKAFGLNDVGYGIYDLYDLGEFDQKGGIRTKYGTKEELISLIDKAHEKGIKVYGDFVLNHKAGADETQLFKAVKVDSNDRTKDMEPPKDINGWTKFTFTGRKGKHSDFKWSFEHFSGVDYDDITKEKAIFRILGENKYWNENVSKEKGNFDYLMFADIDHDHPAVVEELKRWAEWVINETKIDGIRYDAMKHIDGAFLNDFTDFILNEVKSDMYFVGEYWENSQEKLVNFIEHTKDNIDLFDVTLHFRLFDAGWKKEKFDLRTLFDNSLESQRSMSAVTFVDNHDSQQGQALESWVVEDFKQTAYAIILLRLTGYPCVFFGDLFGIGDKSLYSGIGDKIIPLMELRRDYAYGEERLYMQEPNAIGFTRLGNEEHPGGIAVAISNNGDKFVRMNVGKNKAGKIYYDYLQNHLGEITIDENGDGDFPVYNKSVSVWLEKLNG